ncbi:glycosyltransferase [Nocardioides sp. LHG3406-4]|uniref:glycosyltransferase n=1 Tax=Nocardioides sp. LHG3406-4 TaxID=2804575 RepID=UPI003CF41F23
MDSQEDQSGDTPGIARLRRAVGRVLDGRPNLPESPARLGPDATRLMQSPLFDEAYYSRQAGVEGTRRELVRHYLRTPVGKRPSPHPLFDREFFARNYRADLGQRDVFLVYLRRKAFRTPTHPLFDTRRYRRRNPGAATHPHGPIGHYQEVGAAAGIPANHWLVGHSGEFTPSLLDWLSARRAEWDLRRAGIVRGAVSRAELRRGAAEVAPYDNVEIAVAGDHALVSVVITPGTHPGHLVTSLRSLRGQRLTSWHALVLDDGTQPGLAELLAAELPADSWEIVPAPGPVPADLNRAVAAATGVWLTFLSAGDTWEKDRLRLALAVAQTERGLAVADVMRRVRRDGSSGLVGNGLPREQVRDRGTVDVARLLVDRATVLELGGFDESLRGAWAFDLVSRIARVSGVRAIMALGVTRHVAWTAEAKHRPAGDRPAFDDSAVGSWPDVVLNRSLIDWDSLAVAETTPGLVSVIIPTYADWTMTVAAVESVVAAADAGEVPVECLVVDNGCDGETSVILDSLAWRFDRVRVIHNAVNHGFALGNNLALPHARGEYVVFLNNDTTVDRGWLEPLVAALADDDVLGAQSLLLYPTGVIQSAGIAFPTTGGVPHAFLQGFPIEDALGIEDLSFSALTGAALAMRRADVVALRGFDPVFRNGMEDVDLCLRLTAQRLETQGQARFVVLPESRVTHHESQTPGRYDAYDTNRELYLQRWGSNAPRDDAALWATRGFRVVDHAVSFRHRSQRRLGVPEPVLIRDTWLRVDESPPRLRWAIKNPAPFGPDAERWGDTHFARAMASALRDAGQEVVIDHRPEHERYTGRFDDVSLVLRGLAPYRPSYEHVTIGWVISHPEMLSTGEAVTYDRLLAASEAWAARRSRDWGIRVEPMLQATDHTLFHPDLAVPDTGHPVLFVGGSRKQFRPIVKAAVESGLPISIYGSQWRQFVTGRVVKDAYLPNAQLGAAYRSAGVVLNDHWEDMRLEGFLSNRLFDAAASGARVITDDVVGLGTTFGRSVQVMHSSADLITMSSTPDLDEIFGSDDERRAVAAQIHREHSFRARAQRLIEIALEARRERGFDR